MSKADKMSFTEHLAELRNRLIVCFVAVGLGFLAAYGFAEYLFAVLMKPLLKVLPQGDKLIFTALPEAFFIYLKVALVAGLILASPVIFYELWRFMAPGLYEKEKRLIIPFLLSSTGLFLLGTVFGYFVILPTVFKFLIGFAPSEIKAMPTIKEYLNFALKLLIAFGLTFEIPILAFFLGKIGVINAPMLRKNRGISLVIILIVAAVLTPPDLVSQILLAIPMYLLYEVSIYVVQIFGKKREDKIP